MKRPFKTQQLPGSDLNKTKRAAAAAAALFVGIAAASFLLNDPVDQTPPSLGGRILPTETGRTAWVEQGDTPVQVPAALIGETLTFEVGSVCGQEPALIFDDDEENMGEWEEVQEPQQAASAAATETGTQTAYELQTAELTRTYRASLPTSKTGIHTATARHAALEDARCAAGTVEEVEVVYRVFKAPIESVSISALEDRDDKVQGVLEAKVIKHAIYEIDAIVNTDAGRQHNWIIQVELFEGMNRIPIAIKLKTGDKITSIEDGFIKPVTLEGEIADTDFSTPIKISAIEPSSSKATGATSP